MTNLKQTETAIRILELANREGGATMSDFYNLATSAHHDTIDAIVTRFEDLGYVECKLTSNGDLFVTTDAGKEVYEGIINGAGAEDLLPSA